MCQRPLAQCWWLLSASSLRCGPGAKNTRWLILRSNSLLKRHPLATEYIGERDSMRKILVPIDGSEHSLRALDVVMSRYDHEKDLEIHLLNVQLPVDSGNARMFVSEAEIHGFHQAEGYAALEAARKRLNDADVPFKWHIVVGHLSETIVTFAQEQGIDEIVMGTHGRSALTHLLLGSIASDVVRKSLLPVTLVK